MPQRPGLGRHQQPPLPLIQMREDHRELRRQDLRCFLFTAHTTAACRIPGSYGLFFCKLLAGAAIGILVMVCLGIKRDDRPGGFPADANDRIARAARKMTGAGTRRPERAA